jgi:hypothetical protein
MQPQNQIQTINQSIPTQVQCYFVSSEKDLEKIQMSYNVVYVGINKEKNEVYLRQINNSGLIDFNKYGLISGGQEKNDFSKIMERLDRIENKYLAKGEQHANYTADDSTSCADVSARATSESSINSTV